MSKPSSHRARGAAAAEFALVLPLLMTVVLGAVDWGWYFFERSVVVNATREAARTGTLYLSDTEAADKARAALSAYLSAGALDPSKLGTDDVSTTVERIRVEADGTPVDNFVVDVTYPGGSLTGFLSLFIPENIHARAAMRR